MTATITLGQTVTAEADGLRVEGVVVDLGKYVTIRPTMRARARLGLHGAPYRMYAYDQIEAGE